MRISNYARPGAAAVNAPSTPGGTGGAKSLDDLTDVTITSPADGAVLTYDNGSGQWIDAVPGAATGPYFDVTAYGAAGDGTTVDTTAIQDTIDAAAVDGGVVWFPQGAYLTAGLTVPTNVSLLGAGRKATLVKSNANSINLVTVEGAAMEGGDLVPEIENAQWVADLSFDHNGHTGCVGIGYIGAAYFNVSRCEFRGFTTGIDHYGSLQSVVFDCKFLDNATGIKYSAQASGYYPGGTIPPNRVLVSWCSFYGNTSHGIDYTGGAQLLVEDSEFGLNGTEGDSSTSAVRFATDSLNGATAQGLVLRGCWMEGNEGKAAIEIGSSTVAHLHSISDTDIPTNEATYAISVDGSSGTQTVVIDRVVVAAGATTRGIYRTGSGAVLDIRRSLAVLAGSGGLVRQDPLLDGTAVIDESQMTALRLPNLTETARDAIGSPTAGMVVFNTTSGVVDQYDGAAWGPLGGGTTAATGGPLLISDDHSTPIVFGDLLLTEDEDDLLYADSW